MSIQSKIEEIIDRRIGRNAYEGKGHLEVIRQKGAFFTDLTHLLDEFSALRETILSQIKEQKGEYYVMSIEDPTFMDKVELADPAAALLQLQRCQQECERLSKRFNRDTINISVVGRAGQGKSRLLQSISGVENDIIPADTGGDCTGAKSTIANAPGQMHAKIKFYTEQEIVGQINGYLEKIGASSYTIGSVSQISHIPVNSIQVTTTTQESLLEHLKKYVEHYDKYSGNLGQEIDETDKSRIRYYVAQYATGNPDEHYYAYLGVKEVTIYTPFPTSDVGRIMLVDTIGLGDTSMNLEEKMLDTLANDSDAAIVVRKADAQRDGIRNEDNQLYDMLAKALGDSGLKYWLFYVINSCEALNNTRTGKILLDAFKKKQESGAQEFAELMLVDCGNQEDVREKLLLPMLNFLASNLLNVDNNLLKSANAEFIKAYQLYFDFSGKVQNVLSGGFKKALQTGGKFDELYEDQLMLARRLEELIGKYSDKDAECDVIREEVMNVIANIASHCPTSEEILNRLTSGGPEAYPDNVYNYYSGNLRAAVRDEFEQINSSAIAGLQEGFKREVCEILESNDGGKLKNIPLQKEIEDGDSVAWLGALIDEKLSDFPLVVEAFNDIYTYRLNIEGLLEFKADRSLECLDPSPQNKAFIRPVFQGLEQNDIVEIIEQSLQNAIPVVADAMMGGIKELLIIPYNSFNARLRKLKDRVIIKEQGRRDLKNFYRENATAIWADEFRAMATKEVALGQLNEYCDKVKEKNVKDKFTIKLA